MQVNLLTRINLVIKESLEADLSYLSYAMVINLGDLNYYCSYGFNRTGFVCCAYLVEELGYTVEQGLEAFGEARPPGKISYGEVPSWSPC